ncbi:hypothetical protein MHYP_G00213460 [Metynnis hypsauchen]
MLIQLYSHVVAQPVEPLQNLAHPEEPHASNHMHCTQHWLPQAASQALAPLTHGLVSHHVSGGCPSNSTPLGCLLLCPSSTVSLMLMRVLLMCTIHRHWRCVFSSSGTGDFTHDRLCCH